MLEGCQINHTISIDSVYTFFKSDFKSDYVFGGERHNFWEIVFVLDGTVGVTAEDEVFVLEKGQAVIHKPDEFHKIWSEFGTNPTVMVMSFGASAFSFGGERILSLDATCGAKLSELYDYSFSCFERSGIAITGIKHGSEARVERFRLEAELLLHSLLHKSPERKVSGVRSAEIYSMAVKYMEDYPAGGLCIDEIAGHCSISSAYLKKIFVRYAGCSVMQYYNLMRARLACGHLSNGRSVKETAILLGFADQNYFSTFFKRIMGMSPTEYRKRL